MPAHASVDTDFRTLESDSEASQLNHGASIVFVDRYHTTSTGSLGTELDGIISECVLIAAVGSSRFENNGRITRLLAKIWIYCLYVIETPTTLFIHNVYTEQYELRTPYVHRKLYSNDMLTSLKLE
jgi:hypothetical protein